MTTVQLKLSSVTLQPFKGSMGRWVLIIVAITPLAVLKNLLQMYKTNINKNISLSEMQHRSDQFEIYTVSLNKYIRDQFWTPTPMNSLWPRGTIWRQRSGSTLVQVMACCLTAPSHYLNHCWFIINKVQRHSSYGNFTRDTSATNP